MKLTGQKRAIGLFFLIHPHLKCRYFISKFRKSAIYPVLLIYLIIGGCSKELIQSHKISVFNDFSEIPNIDLSQYASVQTRPHQDSTIALAAAIAGGGFRATFFTLGVMIELENNKSLKFKNDTIRNLLKEIDYFSSVSGGGYAAGFYIAGRIYNRQLNEIISNNPFWKSKYYSKKEIRQYKKHAPAYSLLREYANAKNLDNKMLSRSKLALLTHTAFDFQVSRNNKKFENQFLYGKQITLGDIFSPKGTRAKYPLLVANATVLGSLAPFQFAPNVIDSFYLGGFCTSHTHWIPFLSDKIEMFKDSFNYKCPLSLALRASSSFPVIFRNISLIRKEMGTDEPYVRLIDGGVYDNSGVKTAFDLLQQDQSAKQKKYLIIINCRGENVPSSFSRKSTGLGISFIDFDTDLQYLTLAETINENTIVDTSHICSLGFKDLISEEDDYDWNPEKEFTNITGHEKRNTYKRRAMDILDRVKTNNEFDDDKLNQLILEYKNNINTFRYIYEISSHIDTNLNLNRWEEDMLILSGRLVVKLKANEIKRRFRGYYKNR